MHLVRQERKLKKLTNYVKAVPNDCKEASERAVYLGALIGLRRKLPENVYVLVQELETGMLYGSIVKIGYKKKRDRSVEVSPRVERCELIETYYEPADMAHRLAAEKNEDSRYKKIPLLCDEAVALQICYRLPALEIEKGRRWVVMTDHGFLDMYAPHAAEEVLDENSPGKIIFKFEE